MRELERLDHSALDAIWSLCQRGVLDAPSAAELEGALFAPEQPAVVLGHPTSGVIALAECDDGPHVRLLVVEPTARGQGRGHALLQAAEDWARGAGHTSLITGADPPYFLWPGVPTGETALLCLLEGRHYARVETNYNVLVDLHAIPDDPGGHQLAVEGDRDEVDQWITTHWSNWRLEVLRAFDKGNLTISRDDAGALVAFCAFEVNRAGLLGPVAVRPDLMGQGRGRPVLLGALRELRRRGRDEVSVVWVGPIVPYALVGGRVSDLYFVYRKDLR